LIGIKPDAIKCGLASKLRVGLKVGREALVVSLNDALPYRDLN